MVGSALWDGSKRTYALLPGLTLPAGGRLGPCSALSTPPTFLPGSASGLRGIEIDR